MSLINSPTNEVREREKGRGKRRRKRGETGVRVWRGVGNLLLAALTAVLKTQLLKNGRGTVPYEGDYVHT